MCGIAAIIGNQKQSLSELRELLVPIAHRGEKKFFNESADFGSCVMGMNRLAIVDRESAKQPIASSNGRYYIVFNGEIYNYLEIRNDLKEKGYIFSTDSDTEVLVNGYAEWGEAILDKISGMFAFIIFDCHNNDFFAARDPLGVKPLYFSCANNGTYYFASEIKSLSMQQYIEEIFLFPPGHFMKNCQLEKYYELPHKIDYDITEQEALEKISMLFDKAVQIRVQTDLPIAIYLSGGLDSTSVLEAANRFHHDVTAIIIGNEQSADRQIAVRYCEEKNIKYIIGVPPTEEELIHSLSEIVKITESFEPNMIRQSAISYYIAKTAADNAFKVILCGEGADEIFAGYPEFANLESSKQIEKRIHEFLTDLHRTQLQRVDRTSMFFTTEVREPFLDKDFLNFVLSIPAKFKVKKNKNNDTVMKYIFRLAMKNKLPEYIAQKKKVVLSEGAGYKGNAKKDGLFFNLIEEKISDDMLKQSLLKYAGWNLETKEDVYYFQFFEKYKYHKAFFNHFRTIVNRTDTLQKNEVLAKKILNQFNTWKFKRQQPKNSDKIFACILKAANQKTAVPFVMYWGKGSRNIPGEREELAISFLNTLLSSIKKVYEPGANVTFILTDTHARLNGNTEQDTKDYFSAIQSLIEPYHINSILFSDFVALNESELLERKTNSVIDDNILETLKISASKHSKNYSTHDAAIFYYLQNQIEKKAVSQKFPDHIFMTYNGSNMDFLFPDDLPIFYMYSISKGHSEKPWHY